MRRASHSTPVTFGLRSAAASLSNFPKFQQAGDIKIGNGAATIAQKGALLTAVAAILRYHQNRGELGSPNGSADPAALNQFLTAYCPTDVKGTQTCDGFLAGSDGGEQVVNLWRAAEFTGAADVEVAAPTPAAIADFLAQGSPVLLSLAMSLNGSPAGGHFVVATGIAADGSIAIQDPSPLFARTSLADYLNGFNAGGSAWKASVRGIARFALRSPLSTRFLVAALSQPVALMQIARHGYHFGGRDLRASRSSSSIRWMRRGTPAAGTAALPYYCLRWRADVLSDCRSAAAQPFHAQLTDLAPGGSRTDLSGSAPATYRATRPQFYLTLAPQDVSFTAASVVNGATFAPGIAPGGVVSIFGTGLSGPGKTTTVDMDGVAMPHPVRDPVPDQCGRAADDGTRRAYYADSVCIRIVAAGCDGFGGGSWDLLDRKSADRCDYEPEFQSRATIEPAKSGTVDGYFCHRAGRGDTGRATLADQRPGNRVVERCGASGIFCRSGARLHRAISSECDDPGWYAAGAEYSPDAQSWWSAKQFGVGSVTVIDKKMGLSGVKLLTLGLAT